MFKSKDFKEQSPLEFSNLKGTTLRSDRGNMVGKSNLRAGPEAGDVSTAILF